MPRLKNTYIALLISRWLANRYFSAKTACIPFRFHGWTRVRATEALAIVARFYCGPRTYVYQNRKTTSVTVIGTLIWKKKTKTSTIVVYLRAPNCRD